MVFGKKKKSKELELPPELPESDLEEEFDLSTGNPAEKRSAVESPKKSPESDVNKITIGDGQTEANMRLYEAVLLLSRILEEQRRANEVLSELLVKVSEEQN